MRIGIYPGTFDPITLGHVDIIRRGSGIFDKVTVGIGINPEKKPLFSPEERLDLTRKVLASTSNVEVECFIGLTVNFVRRCGASVMLRGLRTLTDIEGEFTIALANRVLAPDIETVFLMAGEKYTHISSSLIKQIAQMGQHDSAEQHLVGVRHAARQLGAEAAAQQQAYEIGRGFAWTGELAALLEQYEKERKTYPTLRDFGPKLAEFFAGVAAKAAPAEKSLPR